MVYSVRFCGRLFATVALLLCFAGAGAIARDITEAETAKLTDAVTRFDEAIKAKDINVLVKAIPPRILKQMAARDGVSEVEISKAMADLIDQTMQALPVHSFKMKLKEADRGELQDGTPYLLIPTDTVMDAGGADKVVMRAPTLALLDGNEWYLIKTNDPQLVSVLREAYPDYVGVEFPEAVMEPFKE